MIKSKRLFIIQICSLSLIAFSVLYYYAGKTSFWLDELFSVGFINSKQDLLSVINLFLSKEFAPPLFGIVSYFWYRLVPHTEQALRALSIFFALSGCVVTALAAYKVRGVSLWPVFFLVHVNE